MLWKKHFRIGPLLAQAAEDRTPVLRPSEAVLPVRRFNPSGTRLIALNDARDEKTVRTQSPVDKMSSICAPTVSSVLLNWEVFCD